jgi:hypothetical protein
MSTEYEPFSVVITSPYFVDLSSDVLLVPYRNPTSCGAGDVLIPSNEAVRVAPDALTLEDETAVMFPSPEVSPPDWFHSPTKEMLSIRALLLPVFLIVRSNEVTEELLFVIVHSFPPPLMVIAEFVEDKLKVVLFERNIRVKLVLPPVGIPLTVRLPPLLAISNSGDSPPANFSAYNFVEEELAE